MKFPRRHRLTTKAGFTHVFNKPTVSRDRCFRVLSRENELPYSRLGMAVSKKNCKLACGRNRIKRVIRESFRQHQPSPGNGPGRDFVVLPTRDAASICNQDLAGLLEKHWQRSDTDVRAPKAPQKTKD